MCPTTTAASLPPTRGDTRARTLDDGRLAVLRGLLEQQRAFRVQQLVQLRQPAAPGTLHRPPSTVDLEVAASLDAGARAALHEVQNALWRMDEGTYGRCTSCGEQLGLERLEILPQAALCMPCQRRSDDATQR